MATIEELRATDSEKFLEYLDVYGEELRSGEIDFDWTEAQVRHYMGHDDPRSHAANVQHGEFTATGGKGPGKKIHL